MGKVITFRPKNDVEIETEDAELIAKALRDAFSESEVEAMRRELGEYDDDEDQDQGQ